MRVGLNLIFLVPGRTGGMEIYARRLTAALVEAAPEVRFTVFVNEETAGESWGDLAPTVVVPVRASRRTEWVRGEQLLLPRLAARERVDLLHSLGSTAPAWGRFRRVATVQDLIYLLYPETHSRARSLGLRVLVPLGARRADRVIVPSESTRTDVVGRLHIPESKVDVVPLGNDGSGSAEPENEETLRHRYELLNRRVVLEASGYKARHKNLSRLLEALALIPPDRRPVLLMTGAPTEYERELRARTVELGLEQDTRFTGWVSPAELEGLYRISSCLVMPSLYEGFGLSVVEAMARGVPVACSGGGSLAEVAGDAALLFDPESVVGIVTALEMLLGDEREANRLRALGLARAAEFTWAETARRTIECYERVLASPANA
jgi:glycosyltransferase involved in cell wall biosynthesis